MLMLIFLSLITISYLGLIISFLIGWNKVAIFNLKDLSARNTFSIVIPYRNEARNLPELFRSLANLNYPQQYFEILLVNDASEDDSRAIAEKFEAEFPQLNIRLLDNVRNTESPKKDAVQVAMAASQFEYIATTDADCLLPENWLHFFDECIQEKSPKLMAGPVGFIQNSGERKAYFQNFEEMDFMSLQASTVGAFGIEKAFMCNAANMCYQKETFLRESGFNENNTIASGDDVFLLQKLRKKGLQVSFIKSELATVYTKYQVSLGALMEQRIRWASKTSSYSSLFARLTGVIVFLMNLALILFTMLALIGLFSYEFLMLVFLLKFNADFFLIYKAAKFMNRETLMRHYLWSSLVYPIFTVTVALSSLFKDYEWKGREFRK